MRRLVALLVALACLCLPAGAGAHVYWANQNSGAIGRASLDGSNASQAFIGGAGTTPCGVAVDGIHVYWAHQTGIGRADLDGSNVQQGFITGASSPCGVAVNGSHVYWANQGSNAIGRANIDGSGANQSFVSGTAVDGPCGVALDGTHVFWANGLGGAIGRAELGGGGATGSFIGGASSPCGVAVNASHVYWANQTTNRIGRANLNGSGANQSFITVTPGSEPCGVALDGTRVWWADQATGAIGRAGLDGTGVSQSFITGASDPCGLAVAAPAAPTVSATDPTSPSRDTTPLVRGMAQPGASVDLYDNPTCSGAARASGSANTFNAAGIEVVVGESTTTTFYARLRDGDYESGCSTTSVEYVHTLPPAAPTFTGTMPASPADDTQPRIQGSAPAGTSVDLYTNVACAGTPAATGTAVDFASPGLQVTVPDGSTTTFYATATDSGVTSDCSPTSITYVELSSVTPLPPPPPAPPVPPVPPALPSPPTPPAPRPAPSLTRLQLTPSRFAIKRSRTRRRPGTTVSARVAAATRVRFTVQAIGRRMRGSFTTRTAGRTRLRMRWTGRLRGRPLPPGRYRLVATPIGPTGMKGQAVRARFRIVAG